MGLVDRPFIYEVTNLAKGRTFCSWLITARQPRSPSVLDSEGRFPAISGTTPLGAVCFSCISTFRRPDPRHAFTQEMSVQQRFSSILDSRPRSSWPFAPRIDIDGVVAAFSNDVPGTFPIVDMRKVDVTAFNKDKPMTERRELILYRLLAPLPTSDRNAHALIHAYEADRNGLLMIGNHIGFGFSLKRAATLSYSLYIHVNPEQTLMTCSEDRELDWWIQEVSFLHVDAGRGSMICKLWSPQGLHVATAIQDGQLHSTSGAKRGEYLVRL
jgi:hypothetical protein